MATNQDTIIRQWHMLRLVPRYPLKATVKQINNTLLGEGFEVTERTVQRDLNELSLVFPLTVDDREKPFGWSWQKDAPSFSLPGLTTLEAVTMTMAEQHLNMLLPVSMLKQLKPYFDAAHQRLTEEPQPHRGRSWIDKVRTVPPTQPLIPPKVLAEVQAVITEALLHEKQVEIKYRKRGEKTDSTYRIHPLALVQRGPMLYLYCRLFDYEDARTLAMNRISAATLLDEASIYPKGFSIDEKVDIGIWGFGEGEKIKIELLFGPGYGDHLLESPLSKDQTVEELPEDYLKVAGTVADTSQLRWWLMGFGAGVEVLSPAKLRDDMVSEYQSICSKYGTSRSD
jgi:predicted DNA-binding transcriptional regulator YafY